MTEWVRALDWRSGWSWVRILLAELRFGTLVIPSTPRFQCISEFGVDTKSRRCYLVSMRRGSKRSQTRVNVKPVVDATTLREGQL